MGSQRPNDHEDGEDDCSGSDAGGSKIDADGGGALAEFLADETMVGSQREGEDKGPDDGADGSQGDGGDGEGRGLEPSRRVRVDFCNCAPCYIMPTRPSQPRNRYTILLLAACRTSTPLSAAGPWPAV